MFSGKEEALLFFICVFAIPVMFLVGHRLVSLRFYTYIKKHPRLVLLLPEKMDPAFSDRVHVWRTELGKLGFEIVGSFVAADRHTYLSIPFGVPYVVMASSSDSRVIAITQSEIYISWQDSGQNWWAKRAASESDPLSSLGPLTDYDKIVEYNNHLDQDWHNWLLARLAEQYDLWVETKNLIPMRNAELGRFGWLAIIRSLLAAISKPNARSWYDPIREKRGFEVMRTPIQVVSQDSKPVLPDSPDHKE